MPSNISADLTDLMKQLFQKNPDQRIGTKEGAKELRQHKWFHNLNWKAVEKKLIKPPFIPVIKADSDISNFDKEFTEQAIESYDP